MKAVESSVGLSRLLSQPLAVSPQLYKHLVAVVSGTKRPVPKLFHDEPAGAEFLARCVSESPQLRSPLVLDALRNAQLTFDVATARGLCKAVAPFDASTPAPSASQPSTLPSSVQSFVREIESHLTDAPPLKIPNPTLTTPPAAAAAFIIRSIFSTLSTPAVTSHVSHRSRKSSAFRSAPAALAHPSLLIGPSAAALVDGDVLCAVVTVLYRLAAGHTRMPLQASRTLASPARPVQGALKKRRGKKHARNEGAGYDGRVPGESDTNAAAVVGGQKEEADGSACGVSTCCPTARIAAAGALLTFLRVFGRVWWGWDVRCGVPAAPAAMFAEAWGEGAAIVEGFWSRVLEGSVVHMLSTVGYENDNDSRGAVGWRPRGVVKATRLVECVFGVCEGLLEEEVLRGGDTDAAPTASASTPSSTAPCVSTDSSSSHFHQWLKVSASLKAWAACVGVGLMHDATVSSSASRTPPFPSSTTTSPSLAFIYPSPSTCQPPSPIAASTSPSPSYAEESLVLRAWQSASAPVASFATLMLRGAPRGGSPFSSTPSYSPHTHTAASSAGPQISFLTRARVVAQWKSKSLSTADAFHALSGEGTAPGLPSAPQTALGCGSGSGAVGCAFLASCAPLRAVEFVYKAMTLLHRVVKGEGSSDVSGVVGVHPRAEPSGGADHDRTCASPLSTMVDTAPPPPPPPPPSTVSSRASLSETITPSGAVRKASTPFTPSSSPSFHAFTSTPYPSPSFAGNVAFPPPPPPPPSFYPPSSSHAREWATYVSCAPPPARGVERGVTPSKRGGVGEHYSSAVTPSSSIRKVSFAQGQEYVPATPTLTPLHGGPTDALLAFCLGVALAVSGPVLARCVTAAYGTPYSQGAPGEEASTENLGADDDVAAKVNQRSRRDLWNFQSTSMARVVRVALQCIQASRLLQGAVRVKPLDEQVAEVDVARDAEAKQTPVGGWRAFVGVVEERDMGVGVGAGDGRVGGDAAVGAEGQLVVGGGVVQTNGGDYDGARSPAQTPHDPSQSDTQWSASGGEGAEDDAADAEVRALLEAAGHSPVYRTRSPRSPRPPLPPAADVHSSSGPLAPSSSRHRGRESAASWGGVAADLKGDARTHTAVQWGAKAEHPVRHASSSSVGEVGGGKGAVVEQWVDAYDRWGQWAPSVAARVGGGLPASASYAARDGDARSSWGSRDCSTNAEALSRTSYAAPAAVQGSVSSGLSASPPVVLEKHGGSVSRGGRSSVKRAVTVDTTAVRFLDAAAAEAVHAATVAAAVELYRWGCGVWGWRAERSLLCRFVGVGCSESALARDGVSVSAKDGSAALWSTFRPLLTALPLVVSEVPRAIGVGMHSSSRARAPLEPHSVAAAVGGAQVSVALCDIATVIAAVMVGRARDRESGVVDNLPEVGGEGGRTPGARGRAQQGPHAVSLKRNVEKIVPRLASALPLLLDSWGTLLTLVREAKARAEERKKRAAWAAAKAAAAVKGAAKGSAGASGAAVSSRQCSPALSTSVASTATAVSPLSPSAGDLDPAYDVVLLSAAHAICMLDMCGGVLLEAAVRARAIRDEAAAAEAPLATATAALSSGRESVRGVDCTHTPSATPAAVSISAPSVLSADVIFAAVKSVVEKVEASEAAANAANERRNLHKAFGGVPLDEASFSSSRAPRRRSIGARDSTTAVASRLEAFVGRDERGTMSARASRAGAGAAREGVGGRADRVDPQTLRRQTSYARSLPRAYACLLDLMRRGRAVSVTAVMQEYAVRRAARAASPAASGKQSMTKLFTQRTSLASVSPVTGDGAGSVADGGGRLARDVGELVALVPKVSPAVLATTLRVVESGGGVEDVRRALEEQVDLQKTSTGVMDTSEISDGPVGGSEASPPSSGGSDRAVGTSPVCSDSNTSSGRATYSVVASSAAVESAVGVNLPEWTVALRVALQANAGTVEIAHSVVAAAEADALRDAVKMDHTQKVRVGNRATVADVQTAQAADARAQGATAAGASQLPPMTLEQTAADSPPRRSPSTAVSGGVVGRYGVVRTSPPVNALQLHPLVLHTGLLGELATRSTYPLSPSCDVPVVNSVDCEVSRGGAAADTPLHTPVQALDAPAPAWQLLLMEMGGAVGPRKHRTTAQRSPVAAATTHPRGTRPRSCTAAADALSDLLAEPSWINLSAANEVRAFNFFRVWVGLMTLLSVALVAFCVSLNKRVPVPVLLRVALRCAACV